MSYFVCAHCGALSSLDPRDMLDSGTELICLVCGKITVVLLLTPSDYIVKVRP
jgi:hypothetical protein